MTKTVNTPKQKTHLSESEWTALGRKVVFRYDARTTHGVRRFPEERTVPVGVESVAELFPRILATPPAAPLKGKGHSRASVGAEGYSNAVAEFVPEAHKTTISLFGGPKKAGTPIAYFSPQAADLLRAWDKAGRPLEATTFLAKLAEAKRD